MENISKVSSEQIRNLAMQEVGPAPAEPKIKKKMSKKKAKKLKRKKNKTGSHHPPYTGQCMPAPSFHKKRALFHTSFSVSLLSFLTFSFLS